MTMMAPMQAPMMMNDTIVVTVPSAYSDGEVTLSVMLHISSGRVLSEPEVCSVRANSS